MPRATFVEEVARHCQVDREPVGRDSLSPAQRKARRSGPKTLSLCASDDVSGAQDRKLSGQGDPSVVVVRARVAGAAASSPISDRTSRSGETSAARGSERSRQPQRDEPEPRSASTSASSPSGCIRPAGRLHDGACRGPLRRMPSAWFAEWRAARKNATLEHRAFF